ncbi:MAG: lamin tail domain-containing protein [Microgenomates group bacterium]
MYSRPTYSSVILNEVAIQPTQTVELYNLDSSISADISSWYIDDSGGSTYFTIPSNTFIPPLSCLVFSGDFNFNKSSNDTIRLINNSSPPTTASAILIDSYQYTKAPETDYSFSRRSDKTWEVLPSSLGFFNDTLLPCIPTPTPTPEPTPAETKTPTPSPEPTQIPSPSPTPIPLTDYNAIYLSEVFPYPDVGYDEWVELYNANDYLATLVDWYIDDKENSGGAPKRFSLTINPYEYKVIDISSALFNNTGDTVRLLNAEKQEKDSMEYGTVIRGNSIGRISFDEDTYCEQSPSPNMQNNGCIEIISSPTHTQSPTTIKPTGNKTTTQSTPLMKIATKNTAQTISKKQSSIQAGEVLGEMTTNKTNALSPVPYLSAVSFSYSALTIVSLFIKMRNA